MIALIVRVSYHPDESNFLENEPVSASTSHSNFKNVNNNGEITGNIKKINISSYLPFRSVRSGKIFCVDLKNGLRPRTVFNTSTKCFFSTDLLR